jgi:ABC-type glycerol-3-phosphate transport system substrate-binding protein
MGFKRITAVLLCMLLVITSGCSKNVEVKDEPKDETVGSITIWSSRENFDLINLSANNYNKLHSKVSFNMVVVGSNELFDKLQMALLSKENLPDILCINDEDIQKLLNKQDTIFEETSDDLKKENYLKYKIDNLSLGGKLYGFPLAEKPAVMVLRTDTLEKNQINLEYIKTWQDYIALKVSSALPFEEEKLYRTFLNQLGGSYFDKDGKVEINSQRSLRAIENMKKLYASGIVRNTKSFEEANSLLKKGEIDSALISTEDLSKLYKEQPELRSKLQVIKPPASEEGGNQAISLGGSSLMVINSSKNKSLSLDFTKFTAENRENLISIMAELGAVPAYTNYYDEKGFGNKAFLGFAKELYGINYTNNFSAVKGPISEAVFNIIVKGQDAKITLDELQKNLSIQIK